MNYSKICARARNGRTNGHKRWKGNGKIESAGRWEKKRENSSMVKSVTIKRFSFTLADSTVCCIAIKSAMCVKLPFSFLHHSPLSFETISCFNTRTNTNASLDSLTFVATDGIGCCWGSFFFFVFSNSHLCDCIHVFVYFGILLASLLVHWVNFTRQKLLCPKIKRRQRMWMRKRGRGRGRSRDRNREKER